MQRRSPSWVTTAPSTVRENTIIGTALAAVVLTAVSLGMWRAVALGADGIAAAALILSATTLLSSAIIAYLAAAWQKQSDLLLPAWRPTVVALAIALCATLVLGTIGQSYYANQPVDVTEKIKWPTDPDKWRPTEKATLTVPKTLDRLAVRVLLIDLNPGIGDCSESRFDVRRLGAARPTNPVKSDGTVEVEVPKGIRRLEVVLTIYPQRNCELSPHIETAVFHQS